MAFTKEAEAALDVLMKGYTGPGFLSGPDGLLKQLSKALIERAMEAELSQELGYGKGESGEKEATIALWLGITVRSVAGIWRLYKTKGHALPIAPIENTGRPPRMSAEETEAVFQAVRQRPDITLSELIEKLSLPIKKSQLSQLLIKSGFRYKRNPASKKPVDAKLQPNSM